MMRAVVIREPGAPTVLAVEQREKPKIAADEVLIQVKAAGLNFPDIIQRKGAYPAPAGAVADIPGLEVSGIIVEKGSQVQDWQLGDAVCCLLAGGGYAEYVKASSSLCLPIPAGFSFAEAACLPETVYTVWDNVFRRGKLQAQEGILIQGGAGGIGSTAIQLAKAFGAQVYTTVSNPAKAEFCHRLGADVVINYKTQDFEEALAGKEVHVVLDCIGGSYFEKHINLLAPDGRLVHINAMGGVKVTLNLVKLMQKRIQITGSTLRARDIAFKALLTQEVKAKVWPLMGDAFRPQIHQRYSLEEAVEAHTQMEKGDFLGKLVFVL